MTYSCGDVENPSPDDYHFDDESDAIKKAKFESIDDHVKGVWDDESGELLHIVYQGIVYSS